jgi:hypothetical protein
VQPAAADDLVLEVETDGAGLKRPRDSLGDNLRFDAVAAFQVHGGGKLDRRHDAAKIIEREIERDLFGVGEAEGRCNRPTAGGDCPGAGLLDNLCAAGVPDIVEDDRIALDVQGMECAGAFDLVAHGGRLAGRISFSGRLPPGGGTSVGAVSNRGMATPHGISWPPFTSMTWPVM